MCSADDCLSIFVAVLIDSPSVVWGRFGAFRLRRWLDLTRVEQPLWVSLAPTPICGSPNALLDSLTVHRKEVAARTSLGLTAADFNVEPS